MDLIETELATKTTELQRTSTIKLGELNSAKVEIDNLKAEIAALNSILTAKQDSISTLEVSCVGWVGGEMKKKKKTCKLLNM